MLGRPMEWTRI